MRKVTMADGRTIPWLVDHRAQHQAERPFLVWEPFDGLSEVWSYARFAAETIKIGAGLVRRGIGAGDRVLLMMDNCPEFVLSWFALARLGAVAVCINTASTADDIAYFAEHSEATVAIVQSQHAGTVDAGAPWLRWVIVTGDAGDGGDPIHGSEDEQFDKLYGVRADNNVAQLLHVSTTDPVSVQYTSGTTGRPKGVVWTHANALWGGKVSATHEGLGPDDVHLIYLPMFHTNAQSYSLLATLWAGGTAVLQPRFSVSRFWEVSVRRQCTWTSTIPFCLRALTTTEAPEHHSYRLWGSRWSNPPEAQRFGIPCLGWWGMTETVTHPIVDDTGFLAGGSRMGRPAPEYEISVVDSEGRGAEIDSPGELLVRGIPGLSLFAEYLNDPEATRLAVDEGGWLHTGDLVTAHADGALTFNDRVKDMLKVGGENVSAAEVERVVMSVSGVAEAAVVGAPHEMLDEVPVVFVIGKGDDPSALRESILETCGRMLAKFKVPVDIVFVDEFPRSTMHKVAKATLRAELAARTLQAGSEPRTAPSTFAP